MAKSCFTVRPTSPSVA